MRSSVALAEPPEQSPAPNAEVDYVDAATGGVVCTLPFFDPGLPLRMAYGCGRPLRGVLG